MHVVYVYITYIDINGSLYLRSSVSVCEGGTVRNYTSSFARPGLLVI